MVAKEATSKRVGVVAGKFSSMTFEKFWEITREVEGAKKVLKDVKTVSGSALTQVEAEEKAAKKAAAKEVKKA